MIWGRFMRYYQQARFCPYGFLSAVHVLAENRSTDWWPEVQFALSLLGRERHLAVGIRSSAWPVAEAPLSVAEWAVALRFDIPRATVLVRLLGDTPLRVLGFQTP